MKNTITLLICLLISISTFAQQGINYKAVIKDDLGNVVTGQTIDARISILKNNTTPIYVEDHTKTTSGDGIVILNIGEGNNPQGVYADIDWSINNYLLKIEIDIEQDGTFENMGNTPLKAVPYALHANRATSAFEADKVVKLPEPYILGRSTQSSNARFQFNGKHGWQAAQEKCKATFPGDPNVRAFTLEQIAQAIVLGNYNETNLNNIDQVQFWAITPIAYGTSFPYPHQNNAHGLNINAGDSGRGTTGEIRIEDPTVIENGNNPLKTYLKVFNGKAPGLSYPCMCGTYIN